jgi:hypothetical protein
MRAAGGRLYFPELEREGFKAYKVPVSFLCYSAQPNRDVDVTDVTAIKARGAAMHTSQSGSTIEQHDPANLDARPEALTKALLERYRARGANGWLVERFRRSERYGGWRRLRGSVPV